MSLIFSSPACAPNAGPLKAKEFGTHINVDPA